MISDIRQFIRKSFDIRPGEGRRAVLMQLNIFLIISTLLVVKPTVNGLFLSEIGIDKLPLAFLLVAFFAVLISFSYARLLRSTSLKRIILATLIVSVIVFIIFGLLLYADTSGHWFLYAFYIWVTIFGLLTASQFWILANVVFNAREAKRLFGFIGAGAIAGGIFGGYLTTVLASLLGTTFLPFLAAGLLSLCIPITLVIWKKDVQITQSKFQRRKKIARGSHPLKLILNSSHLTYLAAIIGLSVIVARLVDFQFNAIASSVIDDPDELTAFFGFWFSTFNVISLLIQLLLTRKVVGTLGVGTSLFFLPVSILLGAVMLLFTPLLWAAIFIKLSDGSLKQSINKAAVELLALPIPAEVKNQTKTFIDVVVDSVATGISGLILIFLVNGLELSTRIISIIIIGLVVAWLFFIWKVRQSYLLSFKLQIADASKEEDAPLALANQSIVKDIKAILEKGNEEQLLFILNKLKRQPDSRFAEHILPLIQHPSDRIKEEAIRNLYFLKSHNYLNEIRPLTSYHNQKVKVAAFDYLFAFSLKNDSRVIEQYLGDPDEHIRLAALIALAEESRDNPVLKDLYDLEKRLIQAFDYAGKIADPGKLNQHKRGVLKALGLAKIESLFPLIESCMDDQDEKVIRQAIAASGDTLSPHFVPVLIQFLGKISYSESACHALRKYGSDIIKPLSARLTDLETASEIKRSIPSVIEFFGDQRATDILFPLLQHEDIHVRLAALKSLNHQRIAYPHLFFYEKKVLQFLVKEARIFQDTLSILYVQRSAAESQELGGEVFEKKQARHELIRLLESRLDGDLERIFRLLGLKYAPAEVLNIFKNIQSSKPELQLNALEYLENLLEPSLKKVLIPIVETALLETITEQTLQDLNLPIPDEQASFELLQSRGDSEVISALNRLLAYA